MCSFAVEAMVTLIAGKLAEAEGLCRKEPPFSEQIIALRKTGWFPSEALEILRVRLATLRQRFTSSVLFVIMFLSLPRLVSL